MGSILIFVGSLHTTAGTIPSAEQKARQTLGMKADEAMSLVESTDCYQVFARASGGFAIVSQGNEAPRLLAYSTTATFCPQSDNPGYQWWQQAVSNLSQEDLAIATTTVPDTLRFPAAVAPLLSSTWGQKEPYNYQCPMSDCSPWAGYLPQAGHCATGCVATALGQIMRYHRWPQNGEGSASVFYPLLEPRGHTFTVDFADATYDWDQMLDSYADGYTTEQAEAVSQLLYHCGVASQMIYGSSSSGTTNYGALQALGDYFRYDTSEARLIVRSELSEPQWMELIYQELSAGRPIFYEGLDINLGHWVMGHSFVIDGYDADGLVHVNWGWNGQENGYYDIALLNPGKYGFDEYQDMIIGYQPRRSPQPDAIPTLSTDNAAPVFSLDGRLVLPRATSARQLPPGIYLWLGRKIVVTR